LPAVALLVSQEVCCSLQIALQAYNGTDVLNYVSEAENGRCGTATSPAFVISVQYKQIIAGAAVDSRPQ
jgi:hypothetical protein